MQTVCLESKWDFQKFITEVSWRHASSVFSASILRWKRRSSLGGEKIEVTLSNSKSCHRLLISSSHWLQSSSSSQQEELDCRTEIWTSLIVLQGDQGFYNEFNNLGAERIIGHWRVLKNFVGLVIFITIPNGEFLEMESFKPSAYIHIDR